MTAHRVLLDDRAEFDALLREAAESLRAAGVHVDAHLRRGDAAEALMDVAAEQEARLIVVGPRDLGGGMLQSSVSDDVAHRAPCNVLLFRDDEPAGGADADGGGQRRRRSADVALAPPVSRAAPAPAAAPTRGFGSRRCCRPSW